jgi:hypothetical protein
MHLPEFTLLAIATVAAIAAGFGVGMLALGRPRFGVVRVLFWISALTFWSLGIVWAATSSQPLSIQMMVAGAIGAIAAAGIAWGLWEVRTQEKVADESTQTEASKLVSQAQFAKVAELEQFLGGKDEMDLRIAFDLPNILQKNIATQVIRIGFIKSGREKEFLYSNFTDGAWIAWVKEGHYTTGPSGVHIEAGPKDVLHLVITTKFQIAQKRLIEFANSALIPNSIKMQVTEFNNTLNKNTSLMMEIMDQRMHESENYFLLSGTMDTPYYGVILTDFSRRVFPLKPAADRVLSAIADSWRISK